jgi:anaerobic selenocysteine-containing dehydrogenase
MAPMDGVTNETRSFCRICNAMCGIVVRTRGAEVLDVRGDPEHPLSRGYTCPKGRALPAFHHHPRRLDTPSIEGSATSWGTVLDDIGRRLDAIRTEHGADAVGMYLASGSAFDANGRRAAERFLHAFGSRQRYTATTVDTPSKPLVAELVGGWSGLTPVWDHERSSLLVLVGSNPVVSHGHSNAIPDPVRRLREHRTRGELWVVDPRRTETAALADRHLRIRPGTDHVLLAHLVRELLAVGADRAYLDAHADGVDALARVVESFDAERTAARTGLDPADIADLVDAVRRHGRVSALTGTGCSMAPTANVTEWMLWALHVVTGSYDRPGGMWFNPGYLMQLDTREWTPSDGTPLPGPASRPELPRRFDEYPCSALTDEIETGNIRALLVVGGNPLTALPDETRLRAAFARLEALVAVDVVETATTALATHVLPAAGQLERADVPWLLDAYQLAVATQYTPAVVPPAAQRWPMWRIFAALGERLDVQVLPRGVDVATATDEQLVSSIAARSRGGSDAVFAARSGTAFSGAVFGWVRETVLPGGRFRIAPEPLVQQFAQCEAQAGAHDLVLVPQRRLRMMNSQLRDVAAPGGRRERPGLAIHPDDAGPRGIVTGDVVEVVSGITGATLRVAAVCDDRIRPGVVSAPHGWHDANVGALTSAGSGVDPLTGMVWQSGVPVEVRLQERAR